MCFRRDAEPMCKQMFLSVSKECRLLLVVCKYAAIVRKVRLLSISTPSSTFLEKVEQKMSGKTRT
jgi:hypothetical protein